MDQISQQVRQLLRVDKYASEPFVYFRKGARTRAVVATNVGIAHRYSDRQDRVLVKLYNGKGNSDASVAYQDYHRTDFHRIQTLQDEHIQQSLTAGVMEGVGPYAIAKFIEGEELAVRLDKRDLDKSMASTIINDILLNIWIPVWANKLRFKDCHAGNFVLTPAGKTVMIDTEQMRKNLVELLQTPACWEQRDKHERSGLSRLAGLVTRILLAADNEAREAPVKRYVKQALESTQLLVALASLGRDVTANQDYTEQAIQSATDFVSDLKNKGYLA